MAVIGSGSSGRGGAPGGGTIIIRGTWKLTQEKNGLGERTNRRTKKERKAKQRPPRAGVLRDQGWETMAGLRSHEESCVHPSGEVTPGCGPSRDCDGGAQPSSDPGGRGRKGRGRRRWRP